MGKSFGDARLPNLRDKIEAQEKERDAKEVEKRLAEKAEKELGEEEEKKSKSKVKK